MPPSPDGGGCLFQRGPVILPGGRKQELLSVLYTIYPKIQERVLIAHILS